MGPSRDSVLRHVGAPAGGGGGAAMHQHALHYTCFARRTAAGNMGNSAYCRPVFGRL
jgi:hypothetical protein